MKKLVSDELWDLIEPILPKHVPSPKGGHPWVDDRAALTGIIFVLRSGISWPDLPQEFGCSGMTCWRRLQEWNHRGVWRKLHRILLQQLEDADQIDWSRAVIDSSSVRATRRGRKTGPNPTDRAKAGTKRHLLTSANGVILDVRTTGANRHDVSEAKNLLKDRPRVHRRKSRTLRKPKKLTADRAYDSAAFRAWLEQVDIEPEIARRAKKGEPPVHGSGLGVVRWIVEQAHAFLNKYKRLRIRDDRRDDIYDAFAQLAVVLINFSFT